MAWMLFHHLNNKALFAVHSWSLSTYLLFSGRIPPMLDILKRHFSNFKNDSDHIIVKYSLYNHTTIDLIQLFKKEHKLMY